MMEKNDWSQTQNGFDPVPNQRTSASPKWSFKEWKQEHKKKFEIVTLSVNILEWLESGVVLSFLWTVLGMERVRPRGDNEKCSQKEGDTTLAQTYKEKWLYLIYLWNIYFPFSTLQQIYSKCSIAINYVIDCLIIMFSVCRKNRRKLFVKFKYWLEDRSAWKKVWKSSFAENNATIKDCII